jgi:Co/Zn/Cd efflux system component
MVPFILYLNYLIYDSYLNNLITIQTMLLYLTFIDFRVYTSAIATMYFFLGIALIFYYILLTSLKYKTNIKTNIILFIFYLGFLFNIFAIIMLSHYSFHKSIYFYLKNLINIQLIPLKSEFIMFYTTIIFFFLILTIIIVPTDLIYSYFKKGGSLFNVKYNTQIILIFAIFGLAGVIYSLLINYLGYFNIFSIIDINLIALNLSIYILLYFIALFNIDFYYKIHVWVYYNNYLKIIKEKDKKIRRKILENLIVYIAMLAFLSFLLISIRLIPWYFIILFTFYLYIIFEIIRKRYFLNKETFYQDFYKLRKYFNKRLLVVFGALAFVAMFDSLNFLIYTIQNMIRADDNLSLFASLSFPMTYILPFVFYYTDYYRLQHTIHYYNLSKNIDYRINEGEIKNVQTNPMIIFLSYLALFIVFLISLML